MPSPGPVACLLLAAASALGCRPGHRITTTERTVSALNLLSPPALIYRDSLVSIAFDSTQAFAFMEAVLARADDGLHQRYRPQLDSARAAFGRGEATWRLTDMYVAGDLIENTPFAAVDLRTSTPIRRIRIENYEDRCDGPCGHGERRFRLPDGTEFLTLLLWIG